MKKTTNLALPGFLVLGLLLGCNQGKDQAVVALEEASLDISSAKKAGAGVFAKGLISSAESNLSRAQSKFSAGEYSMARKTAMEASADARAAESEVKNNPSKGSSDSTSHLGGDKS